MNADTLDALAIETTAALVFTYREFICRCPINGGTDRATIRIEFTTDGSTVELGSLKEYMDGFRDEPMLHEDVTALIAEDVAATVGTTVTVVADWKPLEGIEEVVTCVSTC